MAGQALTPEEVYLEATDKLVKGNYEQGLKEYELRWKTSHSKNYWNAPPIPQWTGQPLEGKRIYIWSEQGLGDALMMHRYVAMLEGDVTVEIQPPLIELFRANLRNVRVLNDDEDRGEGFDYHCPTMSLPYAFGTRAGTIPPPAPIRPHKPIFWDADANHLNVGIQWAGNIHHPDDAVRSVAFSDFRKIMKVKGVKFWGLQRNIRRSDMPEIDKSGLTCLWFDGFDALAAIVSKMDLIITVDSALAHLAGAMGKPVWTLIQANPDWRWMLDRIDTPWYPSMRLFRQRRIGKWRPVIDHIAEILGRRREWLRTQALTS